MVIKSPRNHVVVFSLNRIHTPLDPAIIVLPLKVMAWETAINHSYSLTEDQLPNPDWKIILFSIMVFLQIRSQIMQ